MEHVPGVDKPRHLGAVDLKMARMSDSATSRLSRRGFLQQAGAGVLASHVVAANAAAQRVPDPPGRKLGWAVVGLGSLSINQILPAFAKWSCRR